MNGNDLRALLIVALGRLDAVAEELRDLDAAIGDGDLGITVAGGAAAVRAELMADPGPTSPAEVLQIAARRFASANPSTMSTLVAAALQAATQEIGDAEELDRPLTVRALSVAAARIGKLGGAQLGDKTILDALIPSVSALATADVDSTSALSRMIQAAVLGVESTTGLSSRKGRAAWVGDRSIGHADGGAIAYVRLLEALASSWPTARHHGCESK